MSYDQTKKLIIIKTFKEVFALGLKEVKDLLESSDKILKKDL